MQPWRHEIRSRVEEIKTGKVKMIPAEDMWKDLYIRRGALSTYVNIFGKRQAGAV